MIARFIIFILIMYWTSVYILHFVKDGILANVSNKKKCCWLINDVGVRIKSISGDWATWHDVLTTFLQYSVIISRFHQKNICHHSSFSFSFTVLLSDTHPTARMSGCRIFVGRLNPSAREKDVERFFKGYGRIRDIDLKRGFGFVVSIHTNCTRPFI